MRIMACIVPMSVPTHTTARCGSSLFFRAHMEEHQNMRLPHGTTGWNHSYYTGIPHSAPHSLQQLQAGANSPAPVQLLASTLEPYGAATSSSVSCPQVTHSAISPQVQIVALSWELLLLQCVQLLAQTGRCCPLESQSRTNVPHACQVVLAH